MDATGQQPSRYVGGADLESLGSVPETTQIEDPRVQWRREQEHMLKDYLVVAQEALSAQKEIYQVKRQRLELAQQEYQQLHAVWEHKLGSQVSCEYPPSPGPAPRRHHGRREWLPQVLPGLPSRTVHSWCQPSLAGPRSASFAVFLSFPSVRYRLRMPARLQHLLVYSASVAGGVMDGALVFNGPGVSDWEDEKVLELDGGDACII